jgi:ABC-2 type transport system permease protein
VLKRLGSTPLGRPRLRAAKILAVLAVEVLQGTVLVAVGYLLGWNPGGPGASALVGEALVAVVLGTLAFGGVGLILAGTLKPLVNRAVVNALFVVLLLLGGMLIPLSKLPHWLAELSRLLPAAALAQALHGTLGHGVPVAARDWVVLALWAIGAPVVAALTFRWE